MDRFANNGQQSAAPGARISNGKAQTPKRNALAFRRLALRGSGNDGEGKTILLLPMGD